MPISDLSFIFQWWLIFFIIGIFFLPLTSRIFPNFLDNGYIFSKTLGLVIGSYLIFILGILHISKFTQINTIIVFILLAVINYFLINRDFLNRIKNKLELIFLEEILFFLILFFWSFIRANQPDIHGLEKYMDFGFINSILRSEYFPPKDMWFTPFSINYYYFGHLITAVLTKLSGISSSITYNLMLATIAALTFVSSFSIGVNLIFFKLKSQNLKLFGIWNFEHWNLFRISNLGFRIFLGGILIALLLTFAGNLHTIYTFFKPYVNENPAPFWQLPFSPLTFPNSYWYPNATRFIHNTIHEFPTYSFVVSDLHGHVLDIPIVLLTIAILFSLISNIKASNPKQYQNSNDKNSKHLVNSNFGNWNLFRILLLGFLLAVMYMTNVWDGIIYFMLASLIFFFLNNRYIPHTIYHVLFLLFGFVIFSLPFSLNFKPFASGIGVLCAPKFLTDIGKLGPFLFEVDHCQHSPLWQIFILYGFFYFWIVIFFIGFFKYLNFKHLDLIKNFKLKIKNLSTPDLFVLILILFSTLLIIIPEFIYIKDIYPAHYRANTMFKLVYQSFIMLSIASGYIIVRQISNLSNIIFFIFSFLFFILVMIYPYFAIISYYGNLQTYKGLDGINYLSALYPSDYQAILWLNKNIKGQPVILEAQGDSYTDYARVSSNTGFPTVLGWTVHEWLWRGTYDIPSPRISEVTYLYESKDLNLTKQLIKKHNISLIFIGELERQKYPSLNEEKFNNFGKIIYKNQLTKIYKITS